MRPHGDIQTYRVLLRGEGIDKLGAWVGFFTARQITVSSQAEVEALAVEAVISSWPNEGANVLAEVRHISPEAIKRIHLPWFRRPRGGFTFFNDDLESEAVAERIERRASGFASREPMSASHP